MEDDMDKRLKLFYVVAIGWIVVMLLMTILALRNTDKLSSKATNQTDWYAEAIKYGAVPVQPPPHTHRTPTNFEGPDYTEGLVTEYHEESAYPLPLGVFTVVVDGVEYRAHEAHGSLPTPIKPGYYQVVNNGLNAGIVTVIISWQKEVDMVTGFITSERLVSPSN
jgi:hypothetical protein